MPNQMSHRGIVCTILFNGNIVKGYIDISNEHCSFFKNSEKFIERKKVISHKCNHIFNMVSNTSFYHCLIHCLVTF